MNRNADEYNGKTAGGYKVKVVCNIYGNWYGYLSGKRIKMFMGYGGGKQEAMLWFAKMTGFVLEWKKHSCGGFVTLLPGHGSATIVPKAFGGTKARLRVFDHELQPYFFHHQFYANVAAAKAALIKKLCEQ